MSVGLALNTRASSVKRIENRDRSVHLRPEEGAVAAVASAIVTGVDRGIQRRIQPCRASFAMAMISIMVMGLMMMQPDSIGHLPKIHGRLPRRNRSAQLDGPLRPQEGMSASTSQKPSRQFGLQHFG
jgi:hypothetical protein